MDMSAYTSLSTCGRRLSPGQAAAKRSAPTQREGQQQDNDRDQTHRDIQEGKAKLHAET